MIRMGLYVKLDHVCPTGYFSMGKRVQTGCEDSVLDGEFEPAEIHSKEPS